MDWRKLNPNKSNQKVTQEHFIYWFQLKSLRSKTTATVWFGYGQMQIHRIEFNSIELMKPNYWSDGWIGLVWCVFWYGNCVEMECNISNYLVNFRCSSPMQLFATWCFSSDCVIVEQPLVDLCGSCGSDADNNDDGDGIVDDNERICICALLYWPQWGHNFPFKCDCSSPVVKITFRPLRLNSSLKILCIWKWIGTFVVNYR